jgi:hypothetical protein
MSIKSFIIPIVLLIFAGACDNRTTQSVDAAAGSEKDRLTARADSLELDTEYVLPPGDPLSHHASGFAKSGVY